MQTADRVQNADWEQKLFSLKYKMCRTFQLYNLPIVTQLIAFPAEVIDLSIIFHENSHSRGTFLPYFRKYIYIF